MGAAHKISAAEYSHATKSYLGWCIGCADWTREECEPDARDYRCPKCELRTVYGAEEAALRGWLEPEVPESLGAAIRQAFDLPRERKSRYQAAEARKGKFKFAGRWRSRADIFDLVRKSREWRGAEQIEDSAHWILRRGAAEIRVRKG